MMHSMHHHPNDAPPAHPPQLVPPPPPPTDVLMPQRVHPQQDIDRLFHCCRDDDWDSVLAAVQADPWIALTPMVMDNHISTTILHQAITSKADTAIRAHVITTILRATPRAAAIKNGYGSLPLHVICQRNVKMDAQTKERLVFEMVPAYPEALTEQGGVGKRTPLHIIFTDYISPRLTRMMIENGADACFMKDKKGFLPAHVACMRHCSPEKLRMLLAVNPHALYEKTNDHQTLLDLASHKATKAHPNYALIDELNKQLAGDVSHYDPVVFSTPPTSQRSPPNTRTHRGPPPAVVTTTAYSQHPPSHPPRRGSYVYPPQYITASGEYRGYYSPSPPLQPPPQSQYHMAYPYQYQQPQGMPYMMTGRVSSEDEEVEAHDGWHTNNRSRLDSNETWNTPTEPAPVVHPVYSPTGGASYGGRHPPHAWEGGDYYPAAPYGPRDTVVSPSRRKRKKPDPAAHLLLHFSRTLETAGDTAPSQHDSVRGGGYTSSSSRPSSADLGALSSQVAEV